MRRMESEILRADDPRVASLTADGWKITARSFGAERDPGLVGREELKALAARAAFTIRELDSHDVSEILELDAATLADYPGRQATSHAPLDAKSAVPTENHPAFGAFAANGQLIGMTFVEVEGTVADTDFTAVAAAHRGCGIATALKATSVLALMGRGIERFRTGGSFDNPAIQRANAALGYVIDEEWLTLERA